MKTWNRRMRVIIHKFLNVLFGVESFFKVIIPDVTWTFQFILKHGIKHIKNSELWNDRINCFMDWCQSTVSLVSSEDFVSSYTVYIMCDVKINLYKSLTNEFENSQWLINHNHHAMNLGTPLTPALDKCSITGKPNRKTKFFEEGAPIAPEFHMS